MFSKLGKKRYLIALGLVVLLGAGGFAYYQAVHLPAQKADEPEIQTAVVRQGDLVLYASGSGTLITVSQMELGFGSNGPVAELNVQVGDKVKAGDVLAVQGDREGLEAAVAADQLSVMDAQKALQDLDENAEVVAAQAQLDLANAQDALEEAQRTWQYQQEGYRASGTTVKAAEAELAVAENLMKDAKAKYDKLSGKPADDPARAQAYKDYAAAYQRYQSALANLNWYTGHPTDTQQALLDAEVAMAEAKLAQAQRTWEEVKDGPDASEVAMAKLQLANAEAKLAVSQRNLEKSVLKAPTDGTILSVTAEVGQDASGPFITLANLKQLYLEIFLDETDIDKIDLNYEVEVTFDALPDQVLTGRVVQVEPSLYTTGQVSTIKGLVELDEGATAGLDHLLLGMNAAVDVIAGRAEGVALVPVEALRELAPGEYAVFVVENGELKLRPVEVGLSDLTFAEIKSGLKVGEVVSTGIVETQ